MITDSGVTTQLGAWISSYGPILFFVLLALENVVFTSMIVPGLVVVLFGGYLAGSDRIPVAVPLVLCVTGLWTGDGVNYVLGKYFWARLVQRTRIRRLVDRTRPVLLQRSWWFFVIYHFEPVSRMVGALAAGVVGVPVMRWLPFDFLGGALWILFYGTIGFAIGRIGQDLGELERLPPFQVIALAVVLIWLLVIVATVRRSLLLPEDEGASDTNASRPSDTPTSSE